MNTIDLMIYLVLALAVFEGWRRGAIVQLCSLAGLVAAIFLAARYGAEVGQRLGLEEGVAAAGGFAVVLVATVIAVAVLARLLRKLFRFAGFGIPDIVVGIAVSAVKYLLVLSVAFATLESINNDYGLISRETVEGSHWFRPIREISDRIFPFIDWVGNRIPREE